MRAEQSRAEQSRAEQSRAEQIDVLKAMCALGIVCIHVPFSGKVGVYITTLARVAVPIFFMITGYFYSETTKQHKEIKQIKKIVLLCIEANLIFFIWNILINLVKKESIVNYIQSIFTRKNMFKFFVFNESPLAGHLWYLGAILYVLLIVLMLDKLKKKRILYYLIPVLLSLDIIFGKYSLLFFNREFPYIFVRNFLCVGIPYFCIGNLIREKNVERKVKRKTLLTLIVIFMVANITERAILVSINLNAARDHYISTTFLAIAIFLFCIKSEWKNKGLATIGRKYSTWLYIIHPIFIGIFKIVTEKLGIALIYNYVAPIMVYCATIVFLIVCNCMSHLIVLLGGRQH